MCSTGEQTCFPAWAVYVSRGVIVLGGAEAPQSHKATLLLFGASEAQAHRTGASAKLEVVYYADAVQRLNESKACPLSYF